MTRGEGGAARLTVGWKSHLISSGLHVINLPTAVLLQHRPFLII